MFLCNISRRTCHATAKTFVLFLNTFLKHTVHPAGQEQSPVIWWHVPPFWHGHRFSHWGPWLPEGQRSPQLLERRVKYFRHIPWTNRRSKWLDILLPLLTMLPCTPVHRCTLPSRGCRWHRWGTGTAAGTLSHNNLAHRGLHNAIPGNHQCRHRPQWWGYTWLRYGTGSGYCSEVPSSHSHNLKRAVASDSWGPPTKVTHQTYVKNVLMYSERLLGGCCGPGLSYSVLHCVTLVRLIWKSSVTTSIFNTITQSVQLSTKTLHLNWIISPFYSPQPNCRISIVTTCN